MYLAIAVYSQNSQSTREQNRSFQQIRPQFSPKANRRFSSDELREAIDNVDISSDAVNDKITEIGEIESDTHGYGEIIKRLDRVEALQLAAAKRDAQILVAVKKLCLAYTKYNDDNDEIKKMLPMKSQPQLDEIEIRLTAEPTLVEKFRAYLRGFKTSNNPVNFTSMLSVLMSDELVDSYNYKGILNKAKLEGTKIVDIIHDLHKPMDIKTFAKLMRETIDLAKNRHHNEQYRKRQMKLAQQMDL
ncbi:uncharacterized protein LOC119082704 [Bradysia coprophila]|uniref:uncharacterized protein LOC119082704 n=1 Tax=Bradysia coprophila TaxID=38358 RepID=UPI00187D6FC7|nr:uncharacterized protein LOC119082704 [Bradysia coprophila]